MDIPMDAKVSCTDGGCGQVALVILMPTTEKITHLVVNNLLFPETEYLVPIEHIADSSTGEIRLDCTRAELAELPVFNKEEFIPPYSGNPISGPYMMWPYFVPTATYQSVENEPIPEDELAIRRGAQVEATDGHVGRVDEFLINPDSDLITHLVLREGHLWGKKDVVIPVNQIDRFEDNTVYLKLNKSEVEALPTIPVNRSTEKKIKA